MELNVAEELHSKDLLLRDWAVDFLSLLHKLNAKEYLLDFRDVLSMSRSFANEYSKRKSEFNSRILEKNMNPALQQLIRIASSPTKSFTAAKRESNKAVTLR